MSPSFSGCGETPPWSPQPPPSTATVPPAPGPPQRAEQCLGAWPRLSAARESRVAWRTRPGRCGRGGGEGGGRMRVQPAATPGRGVWCPGPWSPSSLTPLPTRRPVRPSTHRGTRGLRGLFPMVLSLGLPQADWQSPRSGDGGTEGQRQDVLSAHSCARGGEHAGLLTPRVSASPAADTALRGAPPATAGASGQAARLGQDGWRAWAQQELDTPSVRD